VRKLVAPRRIHNWLPLLGAVSAIVFYLFAHGVVALGDLAGGRLGFAIAALGYLLVLASPLGGVLAAWFVCRQVGEQLHAGAAALVAVAGMFAVGFLAVALR
jgi:hypothetical protein